MQNHLTLPLLALLASIPLGASRLAADVEPPELVTDRPDQTESSETVPRGWLQLELGASASEDADGSETLEAPAALLRIGLADALELRLGWSGWATVDPPGAGDTLDGAGDGEIGAKLKLRQGVGAGPTLALLASTSVPIGDDALSSDRFDPSFRLTAAHDLGPLGLEGIDFAWNLGMAWESVRGSTGSSTLGEIQYTAAAGFPLGDRLGGFVEIFGSEPASRAGGHEASIDGGLTLLLRPTLQLDAFVGAGLTDDAPDWFVGVGVSTLWAR